jgi:prepilin-type N-terminal cleavage/methylation domain-containing protein/prepilin-type processing-associated H-X9-DG protein
MQSTVCIMAGAERGQEHVARLHSSVRRGRRAGFTLIELLVVIAIIALLMAILLPALAGARESGRRARCASNLHQIALAWRMYIDDQYGAYPSGRFNFQWFYGGKVEIYSEYMGQKCDPRPLNRYVSIDPSGNQAAEMFHCPSDRGAIGLSSAKSWGVTTYDYFGNSYILNSALLRAGTDTDPTLREVEIKLPFSQVVLNGDQQSYWTPMGRLIRYSAWWHDTDGTSMNLGFLDGHAAFTRLEWGKNYTANYSFLLEAVADEDQHDH